MFACVKKTIILDPAHFFLGKLLRDFLVTYIFGVFTHTKGRGLAI